MTEIQSLILGIIQGLTEFLPVSSSGHLVFFQHVFGLKKPELFFDICVHLGTLLSVIVVFWKELRKIIIAFIHYSMLFFKKKRFDSDNNSLTWDVKMAIFIFIGSIPTAIVGFFLNELTNRLFSSLVVVGISLIITGTIIWSTRMIKQTSQNNACFDKKRAFIIGIVQGIAVIPGISRSGSTITAGLFLGLNRDMAARYSFLLSIPAILGAAVSNLSSMPTFTYCFFSTLLIGTLTSFIVGLCALKSLLHLVNKGQLHYFAPYCWIIGITVLFINYK